MDVLVLGAYGMLGHRLLLELDSRYDVSGIARSLRKWDAPIMKQLSAMNIIPGVNALDLDSVRSTIVQHRPDVVVNCIGIVKQIQSARDPITSITINSLFPHQLAKIVNEIGSQMIHFSTDCVFSGKEGGYTQNSNPDPVDLYGRSKLLGEVGERAITIRSSLIGREIGTKNGLVEWFLSNHGKSVKGFRKAIFSGLTTHEMAKVVEMLIDKRPIVNGVWQVASDPISKFELLKIINEDYRAGIVIAPDDQVHCDRSLNGELFVQATGYRPPNWNDMIKSMVKDFPMYEKEG
jgi:dTDP-4-dehydrorhamnose reductase